MSKYFDGAYTIDLRDVDGMTEIEDKMFSGKRWLGRIVLPKSVTRIGEMAFYGCSQLSNVDLSYLLNLSVIDEHAFNGCYSLKETFIPSSVNIIGYEAFYDSGLEIAYFAIKKLWKIYFHEYDFSDAKYAAKILKENTDPELRLY